MSLNEQQKQRAVAGAVGALVGDAAALGAHWLYKGPVSAVFGPEPEFAAPEASKYTNEAGERLGYFAHGRKEVGDLTHSGHGSLLVLRATKPGLGGLDLEKHGQLFVEEFGPGGNYVGYVDHPSKSLLAALARPVPDGEARPVTGDPEEVQMNGLAATLPLAALLAGLPEPEFDAAVARAVRAIQNNDVSVEYIGALHRVLRRVVTLGEAPREAVLAVHAAREQGRFPEVDERFRAAVERAEQSDDTVAATAEWGLPCYLRMGVPSILHTLLTAKSGTEAVRKAILSGGDSAPRAAVAAAVFGAAFGLGSEQGLPEAWVAQTKRAAEARALAEAVVAGQQ